MYYVVIAISMICAWFLSDYLTPRLIRLLKLSENIKAYYVINVCTYLGLYVGCLALYDNFLSKLRII